MKKIVKQRIEETFEKLENDPSLISIPISILEQFKKDNYLNKTYINQWEETLKLPLPKIKELMLSDTEKGEKLRSTSIFIRIP